MAHQSDTRSWEDMPKLIFLGDISTSQKQVKGTLITPPLDGADCVLGNLEGAILTDEAPTTLASESTLLCITDPGCFPRFKDPRSMLSG